ncbi:MAG: pseudouridine-5'-phosphate glycosidase [Rhodobacteraceae bacterium]|nr:pseudouridine-5'-phosphate glycosidase [Paracoccaceae bacterium]
MMDVMEIQPEVADALADRRPVVALESTIITHGMPWPDNLDMARQVEGDLRAEGAVPATIAVMGGKVRVGLDAAALEALARTPDAMKLSRADLAACIATGRSGATTVAATMICAARAGIEVFATGGIGGVHRGAETSFDVSADLQELARSPVTVVCAGAKAILDLPKTLEVLETLGVPVVAYGQDALPAFWSRDAGLTAPLRCDSPAEVAQLLAARTALDLSGGVLVANPIPEAAEIPHATLAPLINEAQKDADDKGIGGKALTPFLLARLAEMTKGRSLTANITLVRHNARLAARIAAAIVRAGER